MVVVTTILNYTLFEEASYKCQSTNNSFHRIFSSCDEDLSDDECTSNDLCRSTSTKRDHELSAKSFGPEITCEDFFQNDVRRLTTGSGIRHLTAFQQQQPYSRDISQRKLTNDSLYSPFRIPDDCQNKLIDLKIGGASGRNNHVITCSSPTPSLSINGRGRSQLLTPARLNFNDCLSASATKTSWVAGGFFVKNLSPQKRQQPLHPISRTSSQSSGFESRASSMHNGYTNGSRESSVADDAASCYFSDNVATTRPPSPSLSPISFSDCPLNINFPINRSFSVCNNSPSCEHETENYYSSTNNVTNDKKLTSLPKSVYHQFGTHRLNLDVNDSLCNKVTLFSQDIYKEKFDAKNMRKLNC